MDTYISNVEFKNGQLIFRYNNGSVQNIDLAQLQITNTYAKSMSVINNNTLTLNYDAQSDCINDVSVNLSSLNTRNDVIESGKVFRDKLILQYANQIGFNKHNDISINLGCHIPGCCNCSVSCITDILNDITFRVDDNPTVRQLAETVEAIVTRFGGNQ